MKYILLTVLFLVFASISFGQLDPDFEELVCKEGQHAERIIEFGSARNEFAHQTDIHYQIMAWDINPANYYINGEITYFYKSLVPDLNQLILDFSPQLQINSITRNNIPLTYSLGLDQLLRVHLNKTLAVDALDTIKINYEGMPPSNGFGSFEQSTHAGHPLSGHYLSHMEQEIGGPLNKI